MMEGRIIKVISNDYSVLVNNQIYICKPRGKFRNIKITPLVGDIVTFDPINNYLLEIKSRKNSLIRPPISNIDQAVIITSVKEPDFSTNLLDKLLVIIEFNNVKPIICFTKLDLLNKNELKEIKEYINYYQRIGYDVYLNTEINKIKKIFKDKVTVFTGQSGAGKSTLLNHLDKSLNLKTDEISVALGRGKHITRHVELIPLFGGLVADTPGFSAISFIDMTNNDIRDNFIEFNEYRHNCKYKDCMHNLEDGCYIKEKVNDGTILKSRYENYLKFINRE
ncbi:MAG: ribosome small subunit-dependent GTPase A [Mollicutes bacterium]|nr:ribosome small subunit-dependent GTPase A [Mollicutes bacterium]